jgi:hypothetical protein
VSGDIFVAVFIKIPLAIVALAFGGVLLYAIIQNVLILFINKDELSTEVLENHRAEYGLKTILSCIVGLIIIYIIVGFLE